jgi:hypothetical protein
MSKGSVLLNLNGKIYDRDGGLFGGGSDEECSYSMSKVIDLDIGGFSKSWQEGTEACDGEIQLKTDIRLQALGDGTVSISGTLELWEGPDWTKEGSQALDTVLVSPSETRTIYEGKITDNGGDWVSVKFEVQNRTVG